MTLKRSLLVLIAVLALASQACAVLTTVPPPGSATPPPATPVPATPVPATLVPATAPPATAAPQATDTPLRTPARPGPTATAGPAVTTTGEPAPTADVAERLQWLEIYDKIWNDVHDSYVYPDFNGADWEGLYQPYHDKVAAAQTAEEYYHIMRDLLDELKDEHSVYLSPDEAREDDQTSQGQGQYVGIGILRDLDVEKRKAVVLLVFPGSPAERAGIVSHDSILAVNGTPVVDDQGQQHMDMIRGPEGTAVTITVQSVGERPRDVELTREAIHAQMPVVARRLAGDVGYLMVPGFDDLTIGDRTVAAYQEMVDAGPPLKGLIIDLRLNHGGYGSVLQQILGLFTEGVVGHFATQTERRPLRVRATDIGGSQEVPIVVLVGHSTESFAEVFSGVLQNIGRARVLGTVTPGNLEIIWPHDYDDGSRAWIATETFKPLNGDASWEQTGIVPDVVVDASWDEFTDATDPQIAAALDLLSR